MRFAAIALTVFVIAVFFLSAINGASIEKLGMALGLPNGSFLHIPGFFMLALLATYYLRSKHFAYPLTFGCAASFAIAVVIELMQWFLPYRDADPTDLLLGTLGIFAYIAIDLVYSRL
jgi:hypothetical protein